MSEEPKRKNGRRERRGKKGRERLREEARKAFAELEAIFEAPLPEDDDGTGNAPSAERQRRSELFLEFMEKYRDDLVEIDFQGKTVDEMTEELRALKEKAVANRKHLEQTREELFQIVADVGDAAAAAQIATFRVLSGMEALSEEELNEMPVEQRMMITDLVLDWVNRGREECLAQLPIATRRELEGG